MTKTAVLTIVSNNYMPYAATLLESVRDTNPDYRRYIFLADRVHEQVALWPNLADVVEAQALGIPDFNDMSLRYDIMEFNTAIKPFALKWLFENSDVDHVIYLDPDIYVYRKLELLDSILDEGCSLVLTPHITRPLEDNYLPDDHSMLKAGVFNLGFVAVSRTTDAIRYLDWWGRRLTTQCYSDTSNNLFTDQRWCDLAPCFVDELRILKDPTYNVAYWNLPHRFPTKEHASGNIHIEGTPLTFFHFSGLRLDKAEFVSKHQNRLQWDDIQPFKQLFTDYRNTLLSNKWSDLSKMKYTYDHIGNLYASPVIRRLYRDIFPSVYHELKLDEDFVISLCNACSEEHRSESGYRVTRLMNRIYKERADLQATFDLATPAGTQAYVVWFEQSAMKEYKLDARVVFQANIASTEQQPAFMPVPPLPNADRSFMFRRWRKIRKAMLNRLEKL